MLSNHRISLEHPITCNPCSCSPNIRASRSKPREKKRPPFDPLAQSTHTQYYTAKRSSYIEHHTNPRHKPHPWHAHHAPRTTTTVPPPLHHHSTTTTPPLHHHSTTTPPLSTTTTPPPHNAHPQAPAPKPPRPRLRP